MHTRTHARTYACMHVSTHARTHACTYARTHSDNHKCLKVVLLEWASVERSHLHKNPVVLCQCSVLALHFTVVAYLPTHCLHQPSLILHQSQLLLQQLYTAAESNHTGTYTYMHYVSALLIYHFPIIRMYIHTQTHTHACMHTLTR